MEELMKPPHHQRCIACIPLPGPDMKSWVIFPTIYRSESVLWEFISIPQSDVIKIGILWHVAPVIHTDNPQARESPINTAGRHERVIHGRLDLVVRCVDWHVLPLQNRW